MMVIQLGIVGKQSRQHGFDGIGAMHVLTVEPFLLKRRDQIDDMRTDH